jgi:thiol-disulfide isomerase/thioredoxin
MYTMKELVAIAKEADAKKGVSPTKSDNSIHRVRDEPERQLGSLRDVIGNIRRDGGKPSVVSIATELNGMHTAQRAPALLALQRTHGNRYVQRVVSGIPAKLVVGQPGDKYEQEADRLAEQVMRMTKGSKQKAVGSNENTTQKNEEEKLIQPKALSQQITPLVQRQIEEELIQTKKVPGTTSEVIPTLESRIHSLKGNGQPLPKSMCAFFEPRFGQDFSQVRVHSDSSAAEVARAINARAFTFGQNIGFASGEYNPGSMIGKKLLAHELVHTIQQNNAALNSIQRKLLPGGFTTDDLNQTCFDASAFEEMSNEDLEALYRIVAQLYRERDREGESGPDMETFKGNIRTIWEVWEQRNIGPQTRLRSLQAGIVQAKFKTSSSVNIYGLEAGAASEQVMRVPEPGVEQHNVDPETLAQIEAENPYRGTRVQEITNAPGLLGTIPLPIPYNQIDPTTVNVVDVWGLGCGPCQNVAQRIIAVSQMPEFSSVRFYHLCVDRFSTLQVSSVPMVFVLLGRGLRFRWDNRSPFEAWLISRLRQPVFSHSQVGGRTTEETAHLKSARTSRVVREVARKTLVGFSPVGQNNTLMKTSGSNLPEAKNRKEYLASTDISTTICNLPPTPGPTQVDNNDHTCTRPCTARHESQHVNDIRECCVAARTAFSNAPSMTEKLSVWRQWIRWKEHNEPLLEIRAYGAGLDCAMPMVTNCERYRGGSECCTRVNHYIRVSRERIRSFQQLRGPTELTPCLFHISQT